MWVISKKYSWRKPPRHEVGKCVVLLRNGVCHRGISMSPTISRAPANSPPPGKNHRRSTGPHWASGTAGVQNKYPAVRGQFVNFVPPGTGSTLVYGTNLDEKHPKTELKTSIKAHYLECGVNWTTITQDPTYIIDFLRVYLSACIWSIIRVLEFPIITQFISVYDRMNEFFLYKWTTMNEWERARRSEREEEHWNEENDGNDCDRKSTGGVIGVFPLPLRPFFPLAFSW